MPRRRKKKKQIYKRDLVPFLFHSDKGLIATTFYDTKEAIHTRKVIKWADEVAYYAAISWVVFTVVVMFFSGALDLATGIFYIFFFLFQNPDTVVLTFVDFFSKPRYFPSPLIFKNPTKDSVLKRATLPIWQPVSI